MKELIFLAGGCFWGLQAYFSGVCGVTNTSVGYANGSVDNPTYELVCSGDGHFAETIEIEYDSNEVSLEFLLDLYFKIIDPTVVNRQGNDVGTQYRTGIYYTNDKQCQIAMRALSKLQESYSQPIVVECKPLRNYYRAETYHQDYLDKNPAGYCHISKAQIAYAKEVKCYDSAKLMQSLTPMQYHVTQEQGTELPFQNEYYDHYEKGIYVDIVSGEPLFVSSDKFESSCGWPAFAKPISDNLVIKTLDKSHGMLRTEVSAKKSGSHLGHLFKDGPKDLGGERYCINSASLRFIPLQEMEEAGYASYILLVK